MTSKEIPAVSQVQAHRSRMFEPSAEKLLAMVDSAMARFDCDVEQERLLREARAEERIERNALAEVEGRRRRALWGDGEGA